MISLMTWRSHGYSIHMGSVFVECISYAMIFCLLFSKMWYCNSRKTRLSRFTKVGRDTTQVTGKHYNCVVTNMFRDMNTNDYEYRSIFYGNKKGDVFSVHSVFVPNLSITWSSKQRFRRSSRSRAGVTRSWVILVQCWVNCVWTMDWYERTCRSVSASEAAISIRLGRHKYLLKWNSFSSSNNCNSHTLVFT